MKAIVLSKANPAPFHLRLRRACLSALLFLSPGLLQAQSTWNTTNGNWADPANWLDATVPTSAVTTQLLFEASGNTSYTTTHNVGAGTFTLNRLTVNNTGTGTVTITGAIAGTAGNTFTFGGASPTLDITGNVLFTGLFATSAPTVTKTGSGTFIHDSNNGGFTGTLIIDQGTFVNRSTFVATTNFNPVSIVVNNGGTYQFGEITTGNPNLPNSTYITVHTGGVVSWQEGEDFGGFHLNGGTISLQQGAANCLGSSVQNWTSGTLTGGAFSIGGTTAIHKTTPGTVTVTGNAAINTTSGGVHIFDGTLAITNAVNLGNSNINLGDTAGTTTGTFDYLGASASRIGSFGLNEGDGIINVANPTTVLTLTGQLFGNGDLTKTGPGKLRLTGGLSAAGTTTAGAGILQVEPFSAFGNFAVANSAVLSVNSGGGFSTFTAPGLHFLGGDATLQFELDTNAVAASPLAVITNPDGLTFTGTPTIKLTNLQPFANGTYTVLEYSGAVITSGFNLVLPGRTAGTLIYDASDTKIDVSISGTDSVKWTGGTNTTWDSGTAPGVGGTNNWKLVNAGTDTNFIDSDTVAFDDTATGFTVNLNTTVEPFAVAVNAAGNYVISGTGKITGATALSKAGPGTFALATDNDYIGGTTVTEGALQLGNGGTTGSLTGLVTLNGGALAFNRSDSFNFASTLNVAGLAGLMQNGPGLVTMANPVAVGANTVTFGGTGDLAMAATISGNGILNKVGPGSLILLGDSDGLSGFSGTLNVNGGSVILRDLGAGGDFGATSIVINDGGTFLFDAVGNADFPNETLITINTGGLFRIDLGENFAGFVLDGGEVRFVSTVNTGVNITGVAAPVGATVFDLRSGTIFADITTPGAGGALNATNSGILTKTTSGTVTISGGVSFQGTLPINILEGTISMGMGNFPVTGSGTITMGSPATGGNLILNGPGSVSTSRPFFLDAGGGTLDIVSSAATVTIAGIVNGPGGLAKIGSGALVLNAPNDYAGGTVVIGGSLEANNFVGSATGRGPVLITGTLTGDGGIVTDIGANDILLNGIFQVGFTGATQGTDFLLSAGAGASTVFGPASTARLDLWSTTGTDQTADPLAADLVLMIGELEITVGATLKLTNPNGLSFQDGDVFRLFDWTGLTTLTGSWAIDSTDLNLGSGLIVDTANLYTSGIIHITVPEPGAATLALLGLAAFALRRRRR